MHNKSIKKPKNPKICPHCKKVFRVYNHYQEHILVKHEQKTPFSCDQCNRSFGLLTTLKGTVNLDFKGGIHMKV